MAGPDIEHHGIKGQKWGVRRFQNKDGSLTAAGKKRYDDYSSNDGNSKPRPVGVKDSSRPSAAPRHAVKFMESTYVNGKRETSYMMTDLEKWEYNHRNTIEKVELGAAAVVGLFVAGTGTFVIGNIINAIRKYGW